MNRVILIGNGFDLAHGLKTSYTDFINDFWEKEVAKMLSAELIEKSPKVFGFEDDFVIANTITSMWEMLRKTTDEKYKGYNIFITLNSSPRDILSANPYDNSVFFLKNDFLKRITEKQHILKKWVDIEYEYYMALLECLDDEKGALKLNADFRSIETALKIYLNEQNKSKISESKLIQNYIYRGIEEKDTVLFLNFNYTRTIRFYTYGTRGTKVIYIHGELEKSNDNPIIFGYGDELDDNYHKIEMLNDKSFLENIKSIKYSITNNYRDMLSFLNAEEYEVFIMGHSCGLSDRTLLNTIFEHEKCKSVKIFYHQKDPANDNYLETYINLSRNFNDKKRLREIVISKENSVPLDIR